MNLPKAETLGSETVNGEDCYKVLLTPNEGKPETRYFDKKSNLLVKLTMQLPSPMGEVPTDRTDIRTVGFVRDPSGAQLRERLLQRVEAGGRRHSLHGFDASSLALEAEVETGQDRPAVDEDRARSALAQLAAVLGPGQREVFAQNLEEGLVRRESDFDPLAVDVKPDMRLRSVGGRKSRGLVHYRPSLSLLFGKEKERSIDRPVS